MRTLAAGIAAAAALAVPAGATQSGLRGTVMRGPVVPVCQAGEPCDAPAKHVTLTFVRPGVSRSVVTDDLGRYRVRLAAGTWSLRIPSARFAYEPRKVWVRAGVMRTVDITIDTGIR